MFIGRFAYKAWWTVLGYLHIIIKLADSTTGRSGY